MMNAPDAPSTQITIVTPGEPPRPPQRSGCFWGCLIVGVGLVVLVPSVLICGGVIVGYYLQPQLEVAKEDADFIQLKTITTACDIYKIDNGEYPPNLEALTLPRQGGNTPYLEAETLISKSKPGQQFRYDASGKHNNGEKPDIWIDGPRGQIGNWMMRVPR